MVQATRDRPWTPYEYDGHRPFLAGRFRGLSAAEEGMLAADLARRYALGERLPALARDLATSRQALSIVLRRHGYRLQAGRPCNPESAWSRRMARRRERLLSRDLEAIGAVVPPATDERSPLALATSSRWDI